MPASVDLTFVTEFQSGVKLAYQRDGAKLMGTTLELSSKGAATQSFPRLGQSFATSKPRYGQLTETTGAHSNVTATMDKRYATSFIDDMDPFLTNISLQSIYAESNGKAMGRDHDNIRVTAMLLGLPVTQVLTGTPSLGLQKINVLEAFELMNAANIPMEDRYALIGASQWSDLLNLGGSAATVDPAFASKDYGMGDRFDIPKPRFMWLGFQWIMHTGLPNTLAFGGTGRRCLFYHKAAVGFGTAKELGTEVEKDAMSDTWLVKSKMAVGAVRIEDAGVVALDIDE